jgi:glycosyltransferase involved in cell wall biosynthesis
VKASLTLVIAVYNAARCLELILTALQRQSMREFQVILADDGSGPQIRELVERIRPDLPYSLTHLWQPDEGFRKNVMLNRAIEASQTEYLVFIDGDCLPHRHFLADHSGNRHPGGVLCGRRVNLSAPMTERLGMEEVRSGSYERFSWALLLDGLRARSSNLEDAIRFESAALRRILHRNKARILGCNFSVEKKLLEAVNGFNEDYRSPGLGEDTDVAFRLQLAGADLITLRYLAVLYHLYHPPTAVGEENLSLFSRVVRDGTPVCRHGLRHLDAVPGG